jgi:pimeloyl-ACP methyl ester carboxylesterase
VAKRKHLVIVLPGIGGSVLARRAGSRVEDRRDVVWDAGFLDIADLMLRPGRMSLSEQLDPVGLITAKRLVSGWTVIDGYDRLRGSLQNLRGAVVDWGDPAAGVRGANIVAVPYDFRRSIAAAAERLADEVKARLGELTASESDQVGRVVVVAHSMGGLVARYWLGPLGGWPKCRALITLGTPHRGAPKALDTLVNGVRLAGRELSRVSDLLREWPSMAELLPRYRAVWDSDAGVARYPHELTVRGLAGAATAFERHREIAAAWETMPRAATAVSVEPRLRWSHPTAGAGVWQAGTLTVTKELPWWLEGELQGWEDDHGDGTVPAVSAVPIELSGAATGAMRSRERHGRIASSSSVADLLEQYEGRVSTGAVQGDERRAALGLGVDELQPAGQAIPMLAYIREATEASVAGHSVWATLRPADQRRRLAECGWTGTPAIGHSWARFRDSHRACTTSRSRPVPYPVRGTSGPSTRCR